MQAQGHVGQLQKNLKLLIVICSHFEVDPAMYKRALCGCVNIDRHIDPLQPCHPKGKLCNTLEFSHSTVEWFGRNLDLCQGLSPADPEIFMHASTQLGWSITVTLHTLKHTGKGILHPSHGAVWRLPVAEEL